MQVKRLQSTVLALAQLSLDNSFRIYIFLQLCYVYSIELPIGQFDWRMLN